LDEKTRIALKRRRSLHVLNDIFGGEEDSRLILDEAIEILGTRRVTKIISPSNRYFFAIDAQVSAAKRHICFDDFCSCPSFFNQAQKKGQNTRGTILCKHLLAVKIAPFVASLQVQEIRDQDFHATLAARSSLLGKGPPPPTKKNKGYGGGGGGEDNDDDRIFDR